MSEETPKNLPEKKESRETIRLPEYRVIKREVLGAHWDGSKTERSLECNGLLHRRCIDKTFFNEKGEVTFAEQLSREELGPCDKKHS